MAVDQAGVTHAPPSATTSLRAETGELGALADADDLAVGDCDRAVVDQPERISRRGLERRDLAIDEQPVPHAFALRRARLLGSSHGGWPNLSELIVIRVVATRRLGLSVRRWRLVR